MLSFTPGELSTFVGVPATINGPRSQSTLKAFDTADLPCPPHDVAVSNPVALLGEHADSSSRKPIGISLHLGSHIVL